MDNKKIDKENKIIEKENKIIDKENLKIDKEIKKVEKNEYIEVETDGINYVISHNQILTVPKITQKEIEKWGKFCEWLDFYTWETVKILDKDYGKSAELMRALLEEEQPKSRKWLYVIIWTVIFIILIILVIVINNNSGDIKAVVRPVINSITQKDLEEKSKPKKEVIKVIQKQEKIVELPKNNIDDFKNSFELQKLEIEYNFILEEKNELVAENFILSSELTEKNGIIQNLTEKLQKYELESQNLSQEAFKKHLGQTVLDRCEKMTIQGIENNCKDLYFKFVDNVNGYNK